MMEAETDRGCTPYEFSVEDDFHFDLDIEVERSRILAACSGSQDLMDENELTEEEIVEYRFDVYFRPSLIDWLLYL